VKKFMLGGNYLGEVESLQFHFHIVKAIGIAKFKPSFISLCPEVQMRLVKAVRGLAARLSQAYECRY